MDRSDFIERGELKVDFLKNYRLVSRWACKNNNLSVADLELLFYLDPIVYFTIDDFKDGTLYYSWDKTRFYRLQKDGWIDKVHIGKGRVGDHNKYKISYKGKFLIKLISINSPSYSFMLYIFDSPEPFFDCTKRIKFSEN